MPDTAMEADWEVEIGGDAPVIDGCWDGFVDLRQSPDEAFQLAETEQLAGFAEVLKTLNGPDSTVWTSKCDVWAVSPGDFDVDELDADPNLAVCAVACYIDLLARGNRGWSVREDAVASCKWLCLCLGRVGLSNCRADLVIRRARVAPEEWNHGVTAYVTACGPTVTDAAVRLSLALRVLQTYLCVWFDPTQR